MEKYHAGLFILVIFVWASLIVGIYMINMFVVPIGRGGNEDYVSALMFGFLKVSLSIGVVGIWLLAWYKMTRKYFEHGLKRNRGNEKD